MTILIKLTTAQYNLLESLLATMSRDIAGLDELVDTITAEPQNYTGLAEVKEVIKHYELHYGLATDKAIESIIADLKDIRTGKLDISKIRG